MPCDPAHWRLTNCRQFNNSRFQMGRRNQKGEHNMGSLLAGKTVVITGAGRGIGLATALHLHDEGAQVVATVRSPEHLTQLKVDDDRLIGRVVDVTDEEQVKELISFTVERFGKLDGIVNNAGIL